MSYSGYGSGTALVSGIIGLGVLILMFAAQWRLLEKAGEKGWKCLIPIYGGYVWYKLTWTAGAWGTMLVLGILSAVMTGVQVLNVILPITILVLVIISFHMTSVSFGKGGGFTVGLCLLPVIFFPILAFGDAEYVGPMGVPVRSRGGETGERAGADRMRTESSGVSGLVLAFIFLGVSLLFFLAEGWLSMVKFNLFRGLGGSPFTGLDNYQRLLIAPAMKTALTNSLIYGLLMCVLTALAGFAGTALGMGGSAGKTAGITAGLLLAAVPRLFWETFTMGGQVAMLADVLCGAMPWIGIGLAGGAMLAGRENGFRSALIVPALFLMTMFSTAGYPSLNLNALTRSMMRMDGYLFQTGLLNAQYSIAAAGYVLMAAIGLVPAVGGIVLLAAVNREEDWEPVKRRRSFPGAVPGIVLAVLLLAGGYVLMSSGGDSAAVVFDSVLPATLAEMGVAGILGFVLFLLIQVLGGKNGSSDGLPRAFFAFAVLSLGRIWITKYLFISKAGLLNTIYPVALSWLLNPLVLTLAVLLALTRPATMKNCLMNAGALALMAMVLGIGEIRGSQMYTSRAGDLSMALYRTYINPDQSMLGMEAGMIDKARNAVWGLAMMTFALPLGGGTALAALSAGKE